jgi:LPXTG-motif cell wall-anchored protein
MKKIIYLLTIITLIITPFRTFGATNNNEIDLTTNPSKILFDIKNVKPGDSVSRSLIIRNNGKDDFNYISSISFLSGSEIFFNKLELSITDKNGIIYEGKLFEFKKLPPRIIKSKQSENLIFFIKIPEELGNEFQGLDTMFQIKLYVEGTLGGVLPADGPRLPNTGSNMFNILVVGAVLVLIGSIFQLIVKRRNMLEKDL